MRIQHNITALSAYRNLTNNNSMVAKNLEKLSSGYRINRAGDDAAGLAISEKMRAQITGLETAQKNANDGISLIQTAEGALTEVHSMLNRMVELANQSANGTYQDEDRVSLQSEVTALLDEIDRISQSTNFNGRTLLNGDLAIKEGTPAAAITKADGKLTGIDATTAGGPVTAVKDGVLGQGSQKLKFSVDLSTTSITNTSTSSASGITGDKISITIGTGATAGSVSLSASYTLSGNNGKIEGKDLVDEIIKNLSTAADGSKQDAQVTINDVVFNVSADGAKLVFEMDSMPTDQNVTDFQDVAKKLDVTLSVTPPAGVTHSVNQGEGIKVDLIQDLIKADDRLLAQSTFDLTKLNNEGIKDGSMLQIGTDVYVFAVGKDSAFKDTTEVEGIGKVHIVDMTDIDPTVAANTSAVIAREAAKRMEGIENSLFKVTTDLATGTIGVTEKGGVLNDYDTYKLGSTVVGNNTSASWKNVYNQGKLTNPVTTNIDEVPTSGGLTLQIGDTSADFNQMTVGINSMAAGSLGIKDIDISTQDGAKAAVDKIKAAINTVSAQRGDLGALQNRLEHTINNLSVTTENITAAESRIRDVDMAKEMMAYTKNNILVQASQAMLAQANQIPQGVLQLLQ